MARVTRKRPSSKSIAKYPVLCFVPRIFTTRSRRCAIESVTRCIRRWITPSARNSSSQRPWRTWPATTQSGRSVLERFERVDDDQVEAPLFLHGLNPLAEAVEPVLLLAQEVRRGPRIEDDERPFRHLEMEAAGPHLFEEARAAFLEA